MFTLKEKSKDRFDLFLAAMIIVFIVNTIVSFAVNHIITSIINVTLSSFFILELIVRFSTEQNKIRYFRENILDWIAVIPWDYIILITPWIDNSNAEMMQYVKLLRLARFLKLVSFFFQPHFGKVRYFTKKILARSLFHQLFVLFIFTTVIIILFGLFFILINFHYTGGSSFWAALMFLLDQGTATGIADTSLKVRIPVLLLTMLGIVLFNGVIVGIINTSFLKYFEEIKSGKVDIVEKDHIVIIGWSYIIPFLIEEIEIYCRTESKYMTIVITSDLYPERLPLKIGKNGLTEVIYKRGSQYDINNLEKLHLEKAHSIHIFGNELSVNISDSQTNDSSIIKSFLTVNAILENKVRHLRDEKIMKEMTIQMFFNDSKYLEYLSAYTEKYKNLLQIDRNNYIALLITSLIFQESFFHAIREILSYSGQEFHFVKRKDCIGKKFKELPGYFDAIIPVGIIRNDKINLLPVPETEIGGDDYLVVLSENHAAAENARLLKMEKMKQVPLSVRNFITNNTQQKTMKQKILIVGINKKLKYILENIVQWNIEVTILTGSLKTDEKKWLEETLNKIPQNDSASIIRCTTLNRAEITYEDFEGVIDQETERIILLADESVHNEEEGIDSVTLFRLLMIHNVKKKQNNDVKIIVEVLNPRNEEIMHNMSDCHYVIGSFIISSIINMSNIDPMNYMLIQDLFNQSVNKIDSIKCSDLINTKEPVTLRQLMVSFYAHNPENIIIGVYNTDSDNHLVTTMNGLKESNRRNNPDYIIQENDAVIIVTRSRNDHT